MIVRFCYLFIHLFRRIPLCHLHDTQPTIKSVPPTLVEKLLPYKFISLLNLLLDLIHFLTLFNKVYLPFRYKVLELHSHRTMKVSFIE